MAKSKSPIVGTLPRLKNFKNAIIPRDKINNYLLHPMKSAGKYAYFKALGYTLQNSKRFITDVKNGLKENQAFVFVTNRYGNTKFQVDMNMGIGTVDTVTTIWQIDKGQTAPRFITAYKKKG